MTSKRHFTTVARQCVLGVIVATVAVTLLGAAPAANAVNAVKFEGKTKGGSTITFLQEGSSVANVQTLIFVTCSGLRAGFEVFNPPGMLKADGQWHNAHARVASAVLGGNIGFGYRIRARENFQRSRAVGKITLSFSESYYNPLTNTITYSDCYGVTDFQAQRT